MESSVPSGGDIDPTEPDPLRAVAQARLAAIVECSDDAIVSKSLEGIVTSWNKGAERIFGWTAEEMIGKPITTIIPPDRLDEEPKILARLRGGDRVDHFETVRVDKYGKLLNVSVTISPIRNAQGQIVGASKVARDITTQKQFQRELEAAKNAAEEAKRVAEAAKEEAEAANKAKDHFLGALSHELRTPLTPVLGAISMLEQDASLPPALREQVQMMRRNVETEARLVDDLLDLTRIARGKVRLHFEVIDAHAVVRNVVAMFQKEIDEKALSVTLSLRARAHHVWADSGRFQQIMLNLLSNAVKFTPPDGSITVRTSNENGTVRIEVADTGVGIPADVMPRLFRPFEQAERTVTRKFGGLGLGLSIVKSLVEMHKASISVTSDGKGRGTTFSLRMESVAPPAEAPAPAPPDGGAAKPLRILLVEDHEDTRDVLRRLLTGFGCVVTPAGSVKEALEAAERASFDLLLSDIGLPDGSGTEVMKRLALTHGVKGIALSGFGQDDDLERSREAGFATHLTKPVNIQVLQQVIRTLVK